MPLSTEWLPLLKKIFFFTGFSEEELAGILNNMLLMSLPKGAVLFRQGDPGDALYLIHSGRVRVVQGTELDQDKTIAYLGRGECLGEMALLTGEPRPNTAVVDATAELLVLYKKDFEPLMRSMPSMAMHIARVLSHRLVETTRSPAAAEFPSKIHPIISRLPLEETVVFTVNLAVSLVEQTRRKILVLDIMDHDYGAFSKALGLSPVRVGESSLRQEDLQSPAVVQRLTVFHPSGLELMSLPFSLMEGKLFSAIYPFLSLLKQNYDLTLVALPPRLTPATKAILEESDKIVYLEKESPSPEDVTLLTQLREIDAPEKVFRVQLAESSLTGASTTDFRVPWSAEFGKDALEKRTPFVLQHKSTQRAIDRLARQFGRLRIGFAMGSGASFGYTLIGMLRVMEKNGIYPDLIAGTSMGALIGSFYANGKNPDELEEIALSITKKKLISMIDLTLPWQGLIIGREVLKFLKSILGDVTFDELQLPFTCVATDIQTGEEVLLKSGKVAEAVRGSLSLPFFFQPFFHEGRFLVDGGLVNPVPSSTIAAMGADLSISVNLTTKPTAKRLGGRRNWRRQSSSYWKGPNILEVLMKTIYTMQFEIAQARANMSHVVLAPDLSEYTWAEFYKAGDIIKIGEEYMEEMIPKIKSLLPFYSDYCKIPLRGKPHITNY